MHFFFEQRDTDVQLGYVASSFKWAYAASAPFAGMVGDRFRRCLGGGVAPVAMASASGVLGMHLPERDVGGLRVARLLLVLGAARWMVRKAVVSHAA